jgi:hypothetical protein
MVKGGVPLLTFTVKVAEAPKQICWFAGWTTHTGLGFTINCPVQLVVQPWESVTLAVYVPALAA